MLLSQDRELLAQKGITEEQLNRQLADLKHGFPFLELEAAASVDNGGIFAPTETERNLYLAAWERYLADPDHEVVKFVPASGAASRMFKDLFAFLDGESDTPADAFTQTFFENLPNAPFLAALDAALVKLHGQDSAALVAAGEYKKVVAALLSPEGLNYGRLPKGLLQFHRYPTGARTSFEEHLVEGVNYAATGRRVQLHFTVSPEHRALFEALAQKCAPVFVQNEGVQLDITFSEQKPSTDTVAANPDGSVSLQILESSQIDMSDPAKKALFEKGTHFNPVDLVCGLRDYNGEKFNLPDFVDPATGFISKKSKDGRELLALELPGLWNGAMSDWNTVFVEVPLTTFNPVKTVNDLFRPQHQA